MVNHVFLNIDITLKILKEKDIDNYSVNLKLVKFYKEDIFMLRKH
jgi:hypothetical protein